MADVYNVFTTYTFPDTYAEDPREEVKPKYFRTNNEELAEAYYLFRQAKGADLSIDSGTDNQIVIEVTPADLVQDNHYVVVDNGETGASKKVWFVPPAGVSSDDKITINNTYLADNYTDISDYDDDITDLSNFRIIVIGAENERLMIDGADQILNYFAGDIEFSSTDSDTISTIITAIEDTLEDVSDYVKATHTAGTGLKDEVVTNDSLDWDDALSDESDVSLIKNGDFELWKTQSLPFSWDVSHIDSSSSVSRSTSSFRGTYCLELESAAVGDYVITIEAEDWEELQGDDVVASICVKGDAAVEYVVEFVDGVSVYSGTPRTGDGTWQTHYEQHTVNGSATTLKLKVRVTGGLGVDSKTLLIDCAYMKRGRVAQDFVEEPIDYEINNDTRRKVNLLPNSSFEICWPDSSSLPACWDSMGGLGGPTVSRVTGFEGPGSYAIRLDPAASGQGMQNGVGDIDVMKTYLQGKTAILAFPVKRVSATSSKWTLKIADNEGNTSVEFDISDYSTAEWVYVIHDIDASATYVDAQIYCSDASSFEDIDIGGGYMIIGDRPYPAGEMPTSVWRVFSEVFEDTASGETWSNNEKVGYERTCYGDIYPIYMDACTANAVGSVDGTIDFELLGDGSEVMDVTVANGATQGAEAQGLAAAYADKITIGEKYYVRFTNADGGTLAGGASVHVVFLQLAF